MKGAFRLGSRLKGKKKPKDKQRPTPWFKLAVYAVVILLSLGLLWYLWLSEEGWRIAKEQKNPTPIATGRGAP